MTVSAEVVALAAGLFVALGVVCIATAFSPPPPPAAPVPRVTPARGRRWPKERVAIGAVIGFLVVLLSGWVLAGVGVAVLVVVWGRVFRATEATGQRRRLEALAKWLEDLRDLVRGSNLSLEQALEQTGRSAPMVLRAELERFVGRRRRGVPLDDGLIALADELAHPTADAAIAAMLLASGTSGASLHHTLSELASVARDEVKARRSSDRLRAAYEATMRRLIVITMIIVGGLRVFASQRLAPLTTPPGQVWLLIPLSVWAGAIMWLRSLSRYELPRRYRIRRSLEQVT
jgi:tight adherence protein B